MHSQSKAKKSNYRRKGYRLLAPVTPEKAEEDEYLMSGINAIFNYFTSEMSAPLKVIPQKDSLFWNNQNHDKIHYDGKRMYAVSRAGSLYVRNEDTNIMVHSQFKAGKKVQCAGLISIQNGKIIYIDNSSGHYTPTISMFLTTVHGLAQEYYFSNPFKINITALTKIDNSDLEAFVTNGMIGVDLEVRFIAKTSCYTFTNTATKKQIIISSILLENLARKHEDVLSTSPLKRRNSQISDNKSTLYSVETKSGSSLSKTHTQKTDRSPSKSDKSKTSQSQSTSKVKHIR